jgi:hypothetical protein
MPKKNKTYLTLVVLLLFSLRGYSQFGSYGLTNARNIGLANTYTANSYGLYAVGINPGLLNKMPGGEEISILFPSLTARGYGVTNTLSTLEYYAGFTDKRSIARIDPDMILNTLTEGGTVSLSALIGLFSIACKPSEEIGTFAFTVSDYISAYLHFPGFVAEALGEGISFKGKITLEDFTYKTWWIRSYGLSYSRRLYYDPEGKILKSISGGAAVKYFNGFVYQDVLINSSAAASTQDTLLSASFDATVRNSYSSDLTFMNPFIKDGKDPDNFLFPKAAGKRMGLDLGMSAELAKSITLGLAITDIGKLTWSSNAGIRTIEASFAVLGDLDENIIDSFSAGAEVSDRIDEDFTVSLPTALRAGIAVQFDELFRKFPGMMRLAFDFNKGFNNEPSNFLQPRYSFAMEYQPGSKTPILLSGYSYDKLNKNYWALGLGYNSKFAEFYVSTLDMLAIIGGRELFSISAIFNWKINYRN